MFCSTEDIYLYLSHKKKQWNRPRKKWNVLQLFSRVKGVPVYHQLWGGLSDDLPAPSWFADLSDPQSRALTKALLDTGSMSGLWIRAVVAWHQPVISDDRREIEHDKIIVLNSLSLSPVSCPPRSLSFRQSLAHLSFFYNTQVRFCLRAPSILLLPN